MPDTLPKDAPLEVAIKDDKLTISIGISALAFAVKQGLAADFTEMEVTNEAGFAQDVLLELEREDEEGSTCVHKMLDQCASDALDGGSLNARLDDEDEE